MSDTPGHPIAYTALQPGTPVQTSDGHPFATVQAVLVDEKVAVFDGIVVQTAEGTTVRRRRPHRLDLHDPRLYDALCGAGGEPPAP